ncbi:MAG: hypothetical protein JWR10_2619 [Rubritepida sp.]|nr:hypothetical protein [Rubritepida sp.]
MQALDGFFRHPIASATEDLPRPPDPSEEHELMDEPWLPARDVSLMTLAAFALIALANFFY